MSGATGSNDLEVHAFWRARSSDEILWTRFDDDYIAYHRPSGKTHFLNLASYLLICEVLAEPRQLETIVDMLFAGADQSCSLEHMESMLGHLENLGLVERE